MKHARGNLGNRSGQRHACQRRAVFENARYGVGEGDIFWKLDTCEGGSPLEGARARNHFEGGGEINLRKAAAAIDHHVGANLLDALIKIELFERASVLQRATEVLDGARNMELPDLCEPPEIPSVHFFERVGERQLLNVFGHDTRREIKFGDFVGLAATLDGAGHIHRGHTVVGNNTCDFRRAFIRGLARIGHAVLGDLKLLRSIRSPRCRGRICDTGRRANG